MITFKFRVRKLILFSKRAMDFVRTFKMVSNVLLALQEVRMRLIIITVNGFIRQITRPVN